MDYYTVASFVATMCIVVYTVFYIMRKFGPRRHFYELASKFPGPLTLPIIGNAHLFAGSTEGILNRFSKLSKVYPSPFRFWMGNYLLIYINTPEQLKAVLLSQKTIEKGPFYDFAKLWLGDGLLTAPSAKWRVHRKLMQSTFSPATLQSFIGIFAARSKMITKEIGKNSDGPEFDIYNYTSQFALYTICETAMGVSLDGKTVGSFSYANAIDKVAVDLCKRIVNPLLYPDFIFKLSEIGKNQRKYIDWLQTFTNNIIQTKKTALPQRNSQSDGIENDSNCIPRKKALLDHLIEISNNSEILSDQDLREEVDTIIVAENAFIYIAPINFKNTDPYVKRAAYMNTRDDFWIMHNLEKYHQILDLTAVLDGSDTTAMVLSYSMLMLAYHPEIQEEVYEELCEVYRDDDSEELHFMLQDLTRLTYLDRVIRETMRLFPITPYLSRLVTEDLDMGEHTLPKDSLLFLSLIELHRNEKYWPDPLKFDPDRFLPEEVAKRDSYAYLPFSGGPRSCIGTKYAMMSMKILLATFLREYVLKKDTVVPIKDLRLKWEFVLRPVHPIKLKIERRNRI